jgi:thioredoxin 1
MANRIREYNAATFEQALSSAQAPFLVHFGTDWCSPCKRLERLLLELLQDWGEAVVVGKVNVEDEPDLASSYAVTRNPTVCLFRDGELIARQEGFTDKPSLQELLRTRR